MEEVLNERIKEFFDDDKREKVIFIGAGFSKNLKLPTWEEFAHIHLDILKEYGKINYEDYVLLKKDNFRTIMSMTKNIIFNNNQFKNRLFQEYIKILKVDCFKGSLIDNKLDYTNLSEEKINDFIIEREKIKKIEKVKDKDGIFSLVYNLNMINVTTNYDDILDILANENNEKFSSSENSISHRLEKKVYYTEQDFKFINSKDGTIKAGDVYHIHGSINDIPNMIVSNEDYIKRYWTGENPYKSFIKRIFDDYNVIFLGYGLQELEILNYLFEGENGTVKKSDNKRILLLDCFDYEKSKIKLLEEYYDTNYKIKLCPYSKSKNGFKELLAVMRKITSIKNEVQNNKAGYKRCLELIQQTQLSYEEKIELLEKLKAYKDLQADFFNKINGEYEYYSAISEMKYFELDNINISSFIDYLISIYDNENEIDSKEIDSFYKIILNNLTEDIIRYNLIVFLAKCNKKITGFKLEDILNISDNKNFEYMLVHTILREFNNDYLRKFFKENNIIITRLLIKYVFNDHFLSYSILRNEKLVNYLLSNTYMNFMEEFLGIYENKYIEEKAEDDFFRLKVESDIVIVNSPMNK
ncbi:MAG: SIR2 family protein, partial [Clostridium sp.]